MAYAVKKLARRSYGIKEMQDALRQAGYDNCDIEEVINRLVNIGYLNDRVFAQKLYEYYTQLKPCGPLLLSQKLRAKGIQDELIEEVMQDYTAEKEFEIINKISHKLTNKNKDSKHDLLVRQLQRKGFTCSNIRKHLSLKEQEYTTDYKN